jgi:hypothetical protein
VTCLIIHDVQFGLPIITGILFCVSFFYANVTLLKTERIIRIGVLIFLLWGFIFSILDFLGIFTFKVKYIGLLRKIKDNLPNINFKLQGEEEGFYPNAVGGTLLLIVPFFITIVSSYLRKKKNLI